MAVVSLPTADRRIERYETGEPLVFEPATRPFSRIAFSAAHVVADPLADGDPVARAVVVGRRAGRLGRKQREDGRYRARVAERFEEAAHARKRDRREEIGEVLIDDEVAAAVRLGVRDGRAAAHEAVRRLFDRKA